MNNERLTGTINRLMQNNKELKLSIGEMNNALSRLDGALRADIDKQIEDAYQRGLEDGKAQSERGCEGCRFEGTICTACENCCNSHMNHWTAKSDKIEVGDEVIYNGTTKCIVVRPEDNERYASLIDSDGTLYSADHRECKKTGRHFDIASILEEMKA